MAQNSDTTKSSTLLDNQRHDRIAAVPYQQMRAVPRVAPNELQPTVNIGMIGHVAHGKSTIVRQLSGVSTGKHSSEIKRNMTIKLGYANAKIFRCDNAECPRPACYKAFPSSVVGQPICGREGCEHMMSLVRHVSLVDCPGHEMLMSTMLNAAAVMDAALLVISANEPCPRPQTAEHLAAAEVMGLTSTVVLQNKVDLVGPVAAERHAATIRTFLSGTNAEKAPLLPCSAQIGVNLDALAMILAERLPEPSRDLMRPARMCAIRSFDVNKPGADWNGLHGAVIGGSLECGTLEIGQRIEIRPGRVWRDPASGLMSCQPLLTRIVSLSSEQTPLERAVPGGLVGVGTLLDPSLGRDDGLVGQVVGAEGTLPPVFQDLQIRFKLMRRLVGVEEAEPQAEEEEERRRGASCGGKQSNENANAVEPVVRKEQLLLHVGANSCFATVRAVKGRLMNVRLTAMPVCAQVGQRIAFSRNAGPDHWRLVGWGVISPKSSPLPIQGQPPLAHASS